MSSNTNKKPKYNKLGLFVLIIITLLISSYSSLIEGASGPESIVNVEFTPGDGDVDPLNPENPEIPGNGGTDESGPLALNYVTPLFFGEQKISAYTEEYPTLTSKPYIQVTDLRGSYKGWEVTAKASTFTNGETNTLLGSTITFKNPSCVTPTTDILPPLPASLVVLKTDGKTYAKVVKAEPLTGMGTWLTRWYTDPQAEKNYSVILTVPGGSGSVGVNTAKITWLLMDVPLE